MSSIYFPLHVIIECVSIVHVLSRICARSIIIYTPRVLALQCRSLLMYVDVHVYLQYTMYAPAIRIMFELHVYTLYVQFTCIHILYMYRFCHNQPSGSSDVLPPVSHPLSIALFHHPAKCEHSPQHMCRYPRAVWQLYTVYMY